MISIVRMIRINNFLLWLLIFIKDPSKNVYLGNYDVASQNIWMNWKLGLLNSEHVLKNQKVQDLIKNQELKFDLVLADSSCHESLYTFAHKFNCPLVTIGECESQLFEYKYLLKKNPLSAVGTQHGIRLLNGSRYTAVVHFSSESSFLRRNDVPATRLQCLYSNLRLVPS